MRDAGGRLLERIMRVEVIARGERRRRAGDLNARRAQIEDVGFETYDAWE